MAHNAEVAVEKSIAASFAFAALSPLRFIDTVMQSIISANRFAQEVETFLHASDRELAEIGVAREDVVLHVARTSSHFRTF